MNKISIKPEAYAKIRKIVKSCEGEVGGNGICIRKETKDGYMFIIEDIITYPQYVAAARVITDDVEYSEWLNNLDDYTFNNLKMQWHSHVHMSTFASGTDLSDQNAIRQQVGPDGFYVHLITNKKDEQHWFVYNNGVVDEQPEVEIDVDVDLSVVKPMNELPHVDYSKYIIEPEDKLECGLILDDDDDIEESHDSRPWADIFWIKSLLRKYGMIDSDDVRDNDMPED